MVDTFVDRWIAKWCPVDGEEVHNWLFQYEAAGVRLLLHLRILRHQGSASIADKHQTSILQISERMFEDALAHEHIPHLAFKSGYILFAADIMLRISHRPDLVLRMALRLAGDPDEPPLRTSTRHNGYQMLSMLSAMAENDTRGTLETAAAQPQGFDQLFNTFSTDMSGFDAFQPEQRALRSDTAGSTGIHGASPEEMDWAQIFALPNGAFDYTAGSSQQAFDPGYPPIQAPTSTWPSLATAPVFPLSSFPAEQPALGDLGPLAHAISQRVTVLGADGDLQTQILNALSQLAGTQ